jgi:HD superfamily phosphohydrolase
MHLMQKAVEVLRYKGVIISKDEETALYVAILLHDVGHGPFSHALEQSIVENVHHEEISLLMMHRLNDFFEGKLTLAIQIFKGEYHRKFMLQLISSQLDMDRLDYLKRDSFYSGVAEGNINSDRLIQMLQVENDELVIEEKAIYSVEKFLMASLFAQNKFSGRINLDQSIEKSQRVNAERNRIRSIKTFTLFFKSQN